MYSRLGRSLGITEGYLSIAIGACWRNKTMLFLEIASAKILFLPHMWDAVNQKLFLAAIKTIHLRRCDSCLSLELNLFSTMTTDSLSDWNWTILPAHCPPQMAAAIMIGMNSLWAIEKASAALGIH